MVNKRKKVVTSITLKPETYALLKEQNVCFSELFEKAAQEYMNPVYEKAKLKKEEQYHLSELSKIRTRLAEIDSEEKEFMETGLDEAVNLLRRGYEKTGCVDAGGLYYWSHKLNISVDELENRVIAV